MRPLESRKKSLFVALTVVSASLVLTVACGGGKGDVKSPGGDGTGPATASSGATASGSSGEVSSGGASGGSTTTTSLPDGGELQGAKLGSSTHTEVETKGDGGPKAGPGHAQEPGRSRQDIQTIIMARRDEARACYDKGLKDHPGIEGDLTVKWVIDPAGKVTDASVDTSKSTISEPGVGTCIVEIIKKVTFAPSKGGFETRANYPFNFHPKTFGKADAGK
ncbi:MAG TPA: AgmX/PglI C-terminal domain-containing protein [Labilithrix sp.]|nr:AgmX/PglI C-terminal domain-containing protein [Labilithrix sp.]